MTGLPMAGTAAPWVCNAMPDGRRLIIIGRIVRTFSDIFILLYATGIVSALGAVPWLPGRAVAA